MLPREKSHDAKQDSGTEKSTGSLKSSKNSSTSLPIHLLVLRQDSESIALLESSLGNTSYSDLKKKKRKSLKCPVDTPDGKTALHYAALCGNLAGIKLLLAHGWDPALPDAAGYTPLDVACYFGHPGCVRALLAAHDFSSGILRPLMVAARMGNPTCLSCIVENYPDCKEQIKASQSLVHYAVAGDSELCVRYLVGFGCPVDGMLVRPVPEIDLDNDFEAKESNDITTEDNGQAEKEETPKESEEKESKSTDGTKNEATDENESEDSKDDDAEGISVFATAAMNGSLHALEELIACINITDCDEREKHTILKMLPKALIAAAMHDYTDILEILLNLQHKLEQRDQPSPVADAEGNTLLHYACARKNFYSTGLLLRAGYSAFAENACGVTPVELAAHYGNTAALSAVNAVDGERLCSFVGSDGKGLLHLSAGSAQVGSVIFLLSIGCPATAVDNRGRTPLHYAVCNGDCAGLSCIKPLIVKGEATDEHFVDKQDANGRSALHIACETGNTRAVLMLIQEQAATTLQDADGNTPIMLAAAHGSLNVVRVLYVLDSDFSHKNAKRQNILHLAAQSGMVNTAQFILDQCNVKAKRRTKQKESGEKMDSTNYIPVIELLGDQDAEGKTPLELAIEAQQLRMVKLLVRRGTSVDATASDGTPVAQLLSKLLGEEELNALKEEGAKARIAMLRLTSEYTAVRDQAVAKFNEKPAAGIEFLRSNGWLSKDDSEGVVDFLLTSKGLNPNKVGEYIGGKDSTGVLAAFVERNDFSGMEIDEALRSFFTTETFRPPGESQVIDRFVEAFANHYFKQNEGKFCFCSVDGCYTMAFSIMMLNTDAHNPKLSKRMTLQEFIKNNRGMNDGKDFPEEFLTGIYNRITKNEIKAIQTGVQSKMEADWMTIKIPDIKSTKKRWGYFCKDILSFYKRPPAQGEPLLSYKMEQFDNVVQTEEQKVFCIKLSNTSDDSAKGEKNELQIFFTEKSVCEKWHRLLYEGVYKVPLIIKEQNTEIIPQKERIIIKLEPFLTEK